MARDLSRLLHDTAQEPRGDFDADALVRRARRQTTTVRVATGAGLVALAVVGVAIAIQFLEDPRPSVVTTPPTQPAPVSILQEPQGPEDLLPPEVIDQVVVDVVPGIDDKGARTSRLARSTTTHDYYVLHQPEFLDGQPAICLVVWDGDSSPTVGCELWGPGNQEGDLLVLQGPHGTAGVAADGVETVKSATVHNNVFVDESTASEGRALDRPYDPAAQMRPDLLRVYPETAVPGERIELHFPEATPRGVGYVLEERGEEGWELRYFLYVPDTEDREFAEPTWWHPAERGPGWDDIGVVGSGPNYAEIPDTAEPGQYRICTANAGDNFCTELTMRE